MDFIAKDNEKYTIIKIDKDSKYKKQFIKIANENWEHVSDSLLEDMFETKYSEDGLPANFVVLKNDLLVATCSLLRSDVQYRQDIHPWFGNCYVDPNYRRKGIMRNIQEFVCNYAASLGFSKIYLWTMDKTLYIPFEWEYLEEIQVNLNEKAYLFIKDIK